MSWGLILSKPSRFISLFCCLLVLLTPFYAYAEPPQLQPTEVSPGVITELKKDQRAPYAGILFSKEAAAKLYTQLKFTEEECNLRLSKELDILKLDYETKLSLEKLKLSVEIDKNKSLISVKEDRIKFLEKNLQPQKWYESGEFWFAIGIVGGILITVASGYAISQAGK